MTISETRKGCQEIYYKVGGPPPTSDKEMIFATLDTSTPHMIQSDGADAGKVVHYWVRWVNTRGKPGPWGTAHRTTQPPLALMS